MTQLRADTVLALLVLGACSPTGDAELLGTIPAPLVLGGPPSDEAMRR